jgi:hypothetical protein
MQLLVVEKLGELGEIPTVHVFFYRVGAVRRRGSGWLIL